MPLSSTIARGWHWVRGWPFFPVFAVALGLQLIGEQFPFSPFPMYSGFSKETTVLYVTNAKDEPLAIRKYFRLDASKLKKAYNKSLTAICKKNGYNDGDATAADLRRAGQEMIEFLPTQTRGATEEKKIRKAGLRLYRISFEMRRAGISQSTELVGARP